MIEGRKLGTAREWHFKCDDTTSVGWIREEVRKVVERLHGEAELEGTGFQLMRNRDRHYEEHELQDDSYVHSLRNNNSEECVLLIVPQIVLPTPPQ